MKRRAPAFVLEGGTTRRQVEASPNGGHFYFANTLSERLAHVRIVKFLQR